MTTSFITSTVSPDLIITTPAQMTQAFALWFKRYEDNPTDAGWTGNSVDDGAIACEYMMSILKELNTKGKN